nr:SJCHGC09469 protein [Schistosoma japonicum]
MSARAFRKFAPLFDRVLVQRFEAETKSKGGIMLPEKAKGKVLEATVVAHGPGVKNEKGEVVPVCVTVGDKVFLPEYGGTKVVLEDTQLNILRCSGTVDCIIFENESRLNVVGCVGKFNSLIVSLFTNKT